MKPYISVILPCYNVAEFLPRCMKSLEKQTIGFDNLEWIFVDDASTDNGKTWDEILKFEAKHPDNVIAVQLKKNRCQGGARNVGLEYASADYVGYIDPDDWIDSKMYMCLYTKALQYQCDIVDCKIVLAYPGGSCGTGFTIEDRYDEKEVSIMEGGTHWIDTFVDNRYGGGVVTGIYRKALLIQSGVSFPENIKYEDNYWQSVLLLYVKRYYHLGVGLYFYWQNANSTVHQRNQKYHFDRLEIEKKKLYAYKERRIYDIFLEKIELDFLNYYYVNTLYIMWKNFDVPPYAMFCKMQKEIRELFPEYKKNPYIVSDSLLGVTLKLIDKSISEAEFIAIGKMVIE